MTAHLPWPALVIDGAWDLVAANDAVYRLLERSFLSATTVFGTTREVTVSGLAVEAFSPADDATRAALG